MESGCSLMAASLQVFLSFLNFYRAHFREWLQPDGSRGQVFSFQSFLRAHHGEWLQPDGC